MDIESDRLAAGLITKTDEAKLSIWETRVWCACGWRGTYAQCVATDTGIKDRCPCCTRFVRRCHA